MRTKFWSEKLKDKDHSARRKWDNIRMDLRETEWEGVD
jgi:hypothetical protein